jgi:tRNA (guanine37-N1)-methyltransferase
MTSSTHYLVLTRKKARCQIPHKGGLLCFVYTKSIVPFIKEHTPMQFHFLTLFPALIEAYGQASIMGKAQASGLIHINPVDIRTFTTDKHRKVDDTPYGGGAGMVLQCQPVLAAWRSLQLPPRRKVLMMTPTGKPFTHRMAQAWANEAEAVVFFCGHYEGFDARITELIPELEEVSMGDFVLTGGELPALAMMDATARFIPGVVQDMASVQADSFYNGLLDYPHYTRPAIFEGISVPEVLLSGNHANIAAWRHQQSLEKTRTQRPDLLN